MKIAGSLTIPAALVALSLLPSHAAPRVKESAPGAQAQEMLQDAGQLAAAMVSTTDRLALTAKNIDAADGQLAALDALRDEVNGIGRDLRAVHAEEGSQTEREGRTVAEILPMMQEIAANAEKAIQTFTAGRNHVWATAFPQEAARLHEEAVRVRETLDGRLKLASVREQEHAIDARLAGNQGR